MPLTGCRRSLVVAAAGLTLVAGSGGAARRTMRSAPSEDEPGIGKIIAVRFFSNGDATRVAIELSGDFTYKTDRLSNPDRVFYDFAGFRPSIVPKGIETIPVDDAFIRQIRVAETAPGTTRVVLDLIGHPDAVASQLSNPIRLMIDVHPAAAPDPTIEPRTPGTEPLPSGSGPTFEPPERRLEPVTNMALLAAPRLDLPVPLLSPILERVTRAAVGSPLPPPPPRIASKAPDPLPARSRRTPAMPESPPALAAKSDSNGERSLTRVLGLKLGRVVLDPGHGGHDGGTRGPSGLLEKDLVLDVAKRLGALIEERMGSEVVFTRNDDTFVPLEERTRIANRHKADLFLSIHANSSPVRSTSGIETYYLNFTSSKSALEVAARENASSERSIYDLQDLLQKIALKDKLEESREFASRVQTSLSALSARTNSKSRDRGVRKAPFVVLIGASMPSVLTEIGFVSNPHDEGLMKKAEYRQKIAEVLYKGISQYASSLSHYQVARKQAE